MAVIRRLCSLIRYRAYTNTVFVLILALVSWPASAMTGNSQEKCSSTSLLYELDQRDRTALEKLLKNATTIPNSETILWKVEKDGAQPSYLFATVHVVDESLFSLRPTVLEALAQSKVVALESAEISRAAMRYAMAQAGALMVTTERPVLSILDEEELRIVENILFKAGFPKEMALGFRPWVITMFLADSHCQKSKHEKGFKSLDLMVAEEAKARKIKIVGLEKMIEQYETMASVAEAAQAAWLKASVKLYDRVDDMAHTMAELYRFRRLGAVWDLTRELAPDAGLDEKAIASLQHDLVDRRNTRMLERATPLIDEGGSFIAVGALHLMGETGLVAQLQARGYKLTALE